MATHLAANGDGAGRAVIFDTPTGDLGPAYTVTWHLADVRVDSVVCPDADATVHNEESSWVRPAAVRQGRSVPSAPSTRSARRASNGLLWPVVDSESANTERDFAKTTVDHLRQLAGSATARRLGSASAAPRKGRAHMERVAGWATEDRRNDMAITGVHSLLYTSEPEALRRVLADGFGWDHVDSGDGWLIFAMPPAEMGVHPSDRPAHEISLMCNDLEATITDLRSKGVDFAGEPTDQGFGIATRMLLPGEVEMLLYEPRHATAT